MLLNIETYLGELVLNVLDIFAFVEANSELAGPSAHMLDRILLHCCVNDVLNRGEASEVLGIGILRETVDHEVHHLLCLRRARAPSCLAKEVACKVHHLQCLGRSAVDRDLRLGN